MRVALVVTTYNWPEALALILASVRSQSRLPDEVIVADDGSGPDTAALIAREQQGDLLRIAITGGGCNGLSYKLKFTAEPKRGDILVRTGGAQVVVDPKTALYLKGTVLDYSHKMVGGGFKFTNPNAKASCSCGESFSV